MCTFLQFCCDTIFQSPKDLGARRQVLMTDVTAEMWQEPRVPYVSLVASLPRACCAPFKGLSCLTDSGLRGQTACAIARIVSAAPGNAVGTHPAEPVERFLLRHSAHLMVRSTRVTSAGLDGT